MKSRFISKDEMIVRIGEPVRSIRFLAIWVVDKALPIGQTEPSES